MNEIKIGLWLVVIILILLFFITAKGECFTTGVASKNVYIQNDESVYVVRWGSEVNVYVHKLIPGTCEYTGQWINYLTNDDTPITIHFVEVPQQINKQDVVDKSQ